MALTTVGFAAATCSWIDPATGLPEVDNNRVTWDSVERNFLVGNNGYRFCNFTEVSVQADFSQRILVRPEFTRASSMYRGPSFARLPSHAFSTKQEIFEEAGAVRFTQVVGARTVSPEVLGAAGGFILGGVLGGIVGEQIARQFVAFPPIWSKIQIRIYADGRMEAQLLQHSIFPSLTFFRQLDNAFARVNHPNGQRFYDATKLIQEPDWEARGWGRLQQTSTPAPTGGNPRGINKGITGGSDIVPTPVN